MINPNTTDEYWTVDGHSLHTHAWAITTMGGNRFSVPPLRGDDGRFAYVPGEVWLAKLPGPQTLSLQMFLAGSDPDTGAPSADARRQWNDSWAYLRALFWQPGRQFVLGRRWLRSDASGDPVIQYAEALGECAGDMAPTMQHRAHSTFTADVRLADPFFYGPLVTTANIAVGAHVDLVNPGDYAAYALGSRVQIDLVGPLTAPTLTNSSPTPHLVVQLPGSVVSGETVTLDVSDFVATSVHSSVTTYRSGQIVNTGARAWMALAKGTNRLTLTAASGSGHAVLRFRPPYL